MQAKIIGIWSTLWFSCAQSTKPVFSLSLSHTLSLSLSHTHTHTHTHTLTIFPHTPVRFVARKKREHDKKARMATVLAGREGRDKFGASTGMKKSKTGGLTERQKQRKKAMPMAGRIKQLKNRKANSKTSKKRSKDFKGHSR